jgi:hypothetical protein
MARQGLQATRCASGHGESQFSIRPLPRRGGVVSNELIDRLRDREAD